MKHLFTFSGTPQAISHNAAKAEGMPSGLAEAIQKAVSTFDTLAVVSVSAEVTNDDGQGSVEIKASAAQANYDIPETAEERDQRLAGGVAAAPETPVTDPGKDSDPGPGTPAPDAPGADETAAADGNDAAGAAGDETP